MKAFDSPLSRVYPSKVATRSFNSVFLLLYFEVPAIPVLTVVIPLVNCKRSLQHYSSLVHNLFLFIGVQFCFSKLNNPFNNMLDEAQITT